MSKSIRLYLPDAMYERAQSLAALRYVNLHDVLLESIVLPESDLDTSSTQADEDTASIDEQTAWREENAFRSLHPTLMKHYPGQYVAIHNGQLVDHDMDQVALYRRCRQIYADRFVLIAQVQRSAEETYTFRSPRMLENPTNGSVQS